MDVMLRVSLVAVIAALDLATGLQLLLGAIALVTVLAVGSRKRDKALIDDLEKSEARLEKNLVGVQKRADDEHESRRAAEREISQLKGKCETLERYAAPKAFEALAEKLGELGATISVGLSAQGELIQKTTELQAQSVAKLERVAHDLERLADRLGTSH